MPPRRRTYPSEMSAADYVKQPFSRMTHPQFQRQIIGLCKLGGWRYYFTKNSKGSAKGFPDLVLVRPPRMIYAELKTTAYPTLTKEQVEWANDIEQVPGVEYYAWFPWDLANGEISTVLNGDPDSIRLVLHDER